MSLSDFSDWMPGLLVPLNHPWEYWAKRFYVRQLRAYKASGDPRAEARAANDVRSLIFDRRHGDLSMSHAVGNALHSGKFVFIGYTLNGNSEIISPDEAVTCAFDFDRNQIGDPYSSMTWTMVKVRPATDIGAAEPEPPVAAEPEPPVAAEPEPPVAAEPEPQQSHKPRPLKFERGPKYEKTTKAKEILKKLYSDEEGVFRRPNESQKQMLQMFEREHGMKLSGSTLDRAMGQLEADNPQRTQ